MTHQQLCRVIGSLLQLREGRQHHTEGAGPALCVLRGSVLAQPQHCLAVYAPCRGAVRLELPRHAVAALAPLVQCTLLVCSAAGALRSVQNAVQYSNVCVWSVLYSVRQCLHA